MPAPKGNTNALKHGLYSKRFTKDEAESLNGIPTLDLREEIKLVRIVLMRVQQALGPSEDPKLIADMTQALTAAVTALNSTIRTQALMTGKSKPLDDALSEALALFRAEHKL